MLDQAALNLMGDRGQHLHQMTGEPRINQGVPPGKAVHSHPAGNAVPVLGTAQRDSERDLFWEYLTHGFVHMH